MFRKPPKPASPLPDEYFTRFIQHPTVRHPGSSIAQSDPDALFHAFAPFGSLMSPGFAVASDINSRDDCDHGLCH